MNQPSKYLLPRDAEIIYIRYLCDDLTKELGKTFKHYVKTVESSPGVIDVQVAIFIATEAGERMIWDYTTQYVEKKMDDLISGNSGYPVERISTELLQKLLTFEIQKAVYVFLMKTLIKDGLSKESKKALEN